MQTLNKILVWIFRRNFFFTPKSVIIEQMNEKRALPVGMTEFEEWSNRIISGTMLSDESNQLLIDSQKFALANMLMHLNPTEDHECDAYFIKSLRKYAVNQIADAVRVELRDKAKARLASEEVAKAGMPTPIMSHQ